MKTLNDHRRPGRLRTWWLRVGAALAVVGAQAVVLSSPANAATTVSISSGTITITSAPGRFNNLTINQVGTNYTIVDTGDTLYDLTSPCELSGGGAICPVSGVTLIMVNTGDLSDRITKNANVRGNLNGGDGDDYINAGPTPSANVVQGGNGNDTLTGGSGADYFYPGPGDDVVSGGAGIDLVSYLYDTAEGTVLVQLDGLANDGPPTENDNIMADVENIYGSQGNDILSGSAAANVLVGFGGNDLLVGLEGNDTLVGGTGDDSLYGAEGSDTINAADGVASNDYVSGGPGTDTCSGDTDDVLSLCEA